MKDLHFALLREIFLDHKIVLSTTYARYWVYEGDESPPLCWIRFIDGVANISFTNNNYNETTQLSLSDPNFHEKFKSLPL